MDMDGEYGEALRILVSFSWVLVDDPGRLSEVDHGSTATGLAGLSALQRRALAGDGTSWQQAAETDSSGCSQGTAGDATRKGQKATSARWSMRSGSGL